MEEIKPTLTFHCGSYNNLNAEEILCLLYRRDNELPSRVFIDTVNESILSFLEKDHEIISSQSVMSEPNISNKETLEVFSDFSLKRSMESDRNFCFLRVIDDQQIIIKIYQKNEGFTFYATSYNPKILKQYCEDIYKKYAVTEDYNKKIYFGVLFKENNEIVVKNLPLDDAYTKELNLQLNYGDAFTTHYDNIVSKMTKAKHGLFIFHGEPGSGKSTIIKYLASVFGNKRKFIFIPSTMVYLLVDPSIIPILLNNKNSILVLEDAEKAIISREYGDGNESLVSSLLNITDGILGSMLNLSLIVTFNTNKDKIDNALLRKGRLLYEYEFKKLSIEESQRLMNTINSSYQVKEPMTLAEIYNINSDINIEIKQERKIGFN